MIRDIMSDLAESQAQTLQGDRETEVTVESVVEAVLFSSDVPLSPQKIAQLLGTGDASDVKRHIESLNEKYVRTGASFRIDAIAKGFRMLTLPAYNHWVRGLHKSRAESRLSPAALETLAIVAYKQPIIRADVEAIRGVAVGDMLNRLREMNLVRIAGRAEEIGRPLLYGTTNRFLEVFGLHSLKDLPKLDEDNPQQIPRLRPVPAGEDADESESANAENAADEHSESESE